MAQAYYVLSDPDRRTSYNQARKTHQVYKSDKDVNPYDVFTSIFDDLMIPEVNMDVLCLFDLIIPRSQIQSTFGSL